MYIIKTWASNLNFSEELCDEASEKCTYCLRITSSPDENLCTGGGSAVSDWYGGEISLKINNETIDTIQPGFTDYEYCFKWNEIDVEKDRIQLQSNSNDGVCITSLTLNGNQMKVGKMNNQSSFWIDGNNHECQDDYLSTSEITFQNEEVISSYCKGILIYTIYWA